MTEKTEKVENCTSDRLEAILAGLTTDQMRFVIARQEYSTDKEAAAAIGISARTVYGWPDQVKEAVRLMAMDGLIMAAHIRRRNLAKAMMVKVAGLDLDDDGLRQRVATEIIEWEMGRATMRQEVTGADGEPLTVRFIDSNVSSDDV